jgi:hypothetical protein
MANTRLILDVEVQAGNKTATCYSTPGLWKFQQSLPPPAIYFGIPVGEIDSSALEPADHVKISAQAPGGTAPKAPGLTNNKIELTSVQEQSSFSPHYSFRNR